MTLMAFSIRPAWMHRGSQTCLAAVLAPVLVPVLAMTLAMVLVFFSASWSGAQTPATTDTAIFPLDDIRTGMKGVGKTVFLGQEIEEFDVEILGVLRNIAPGKNLILSRVSGGPLATTGVLAGMSGSPVYIDGKLAGAVAMTFQFIKEPIAGITPIQEMLDMLAGDSPAPPVQAAGAAREWPFSNGGSDGDIRFLSYAAPEIDLPADILPVPVLWGGAESSLMPVATPIVLSGFTPEAIRHFTPQFQALGWVPVQGGGGAAAQDSSEPGRLPEPGSMISVQLVRGDMGVNADGTVTTVDEKTGRIMAFGHPFLSTGPMEVPFSESSVIAVIPGYATSMKISVPGRSLGVIDQDRSSGISGVLGREARLIPVELELIPEGGEGRTYHFEVANDRFLLPLLMNLTVFSAIGATERAVGETTIQVEQTIELEDLPEVRLDNFISETANGPAFAARSVVLPIAFLMQSSLGPLDIRKIRLRVLTSNKRMKQDVEQIWTSKRIVRPGEAVELNVLLRDQDGVEQLQKRTIEIPSSIPAGPLSITVADGMTLDRLDAAAGGPRALPKDPEQMVRALNRSRRNNRLYVRLSRPGAGFVVQGEPFPSLPPSVISTFSSSPSGSRDIARMMLSTVADYEMESVTGVVAGVKGLSITVEE